MDVANPSAADGEGDRLSGLHSRAEFETLELVDDGALRVSEPRLLALGYSEREALGAMKGLAEDAGVADGIRQALKLLSKV